jgi:hypothetical protein
LPHKRYPKVVEILKDCSRRGLSYGTLCLDMKFSTECLLFVEKKFLIPPRSLLLDNVINIDALMCFANEKYHIIKNLVALHENLY